jgi:3'-phosphoadenosine 5'-phosphosulfate sulfotransferase
MWESSLLSILVADDELKSYVSTYGGTNAPSIFSNSAPENVEFPYIVFTISGMSSPGSELDVWSVQIDHFDFATSGKTGRLAGYRIEELLDRQHLQHAKFKTIRLYKDWSAPAGRVEEDKDPKSQHFIVRLTARAGRKGWIDNLVFMSGD